jgi:hypothetical protein
LSSWSSGEYEQADRTNLDVRAHRGCLLRVDR